MEEILKTLIVPSISLVQALLVAAIAFLGVAVGLLGTGYLQRRADQRLEKRELRVRRLDKAEELVALLRQLFYEEGVTLPSSDAGEMVHSALSSPWPAVVSKVEIYFPELNGELQALGNEITASWKLRAEGHSKMLQGQGNTLDMANETTEQFARLAAAIRTLQRKVGLIGSELAGLHHETDAVGSEGIR